MAAVSVPPPTDQRRQDAQPGHAAGVNLFNRPPRILRVLPRDEVEIPGPPQQAAAGASPRLIAVIIPLVAALVYVTVAIGRGSQNGGALISALPIAMLSLVSGGAALYTYRQQKHAQAAAQQSYIDNYHGALERTRRQLQQLEQAQRACYEANDPDLSALLQIARGSGSHDGMPLPAERLWERRPDDSDFLRLRVGRGDQGTSITIKPPSANAYSKDMEAALNLAAQFQMVRNVPVSVLLRATGSLGIAGPSGRSLDALRALLWQIAVHHAPSEVRIAAFWDSAFDTSWEWLSWLPHTRSLDGDQTYRLLARYDRHPDDLQQVVGALAKELKRRADDQNTGSRPHIVVVLSDHHRFGAAHPLFGQLISAGSAGISVICLVPAVRHVPSDCGGYLDLATASAEYAAIALAGPGGGYTSVKADMADAQQSSLLARVLAGVELTDADGSREMPRNVQLLPLLSIADAQSYTPQTLWADAPKNSWHPVPVGRQGADTLIEIDLNEGVHGVHGMIAGATGAGKSELLLSFLMSLAIRHHPDRLNFMLIDFKGGATFRELEKLPHTAGFVTDLSGFLAERALIAINSELDRRKRLLSAKGMPNIKSYRKAGLDVRGQPIPNMLIAIDEFDEMIRDFPEFQTELIRVAKQGRSLGVHLLFATQQPSLIKEGLLNNLSYWMSLRVNSKEDSRAMVGLPDAALLGTDTPGRGFFRDKNSGMRMFQSALITAPYHHTPGRSSNETDVTGKQRTTTDESRARQALRGLLAQLVEDLRGTTLTEVRLDSTIDEVCRRFSQVPDTATDGEEQQQRRKRLATQAIQAFLLSIKELKFNAAAISEEQAIEQQLDEAAHALLVALHGEREQISEIRLIARRMAEAQGECYAARQYPIWTEPLPSLLPLVDLLSPVANGWLQAPIGLMDRPEEAKRQPLLCDVAGAGGNILAIGASGSGKTTLLRSLILALAHAHSPGEVWFYLIDSTGGGLGLGAKLPHIADTFAPRQHVRVERLMTTLQERLEERRLLFQRHGVTTITQYRERAPHDAPAALFVLIDNLAELNSQNETLMDTVRSLMRESRAYGIYFIVAAYTMRDVSPIAANFETRLALRLNSDDDSFQLLGKDYASKLIKPDQPGRAFMRSSPRPVELHIALPTLRRRARVTSADTQEDDTDVSYSDTAMELEVSVAELCRKWQGYCRDHARRLPQPLRLLPPAVSLGTLLDELPTSPAPACVAPLGIDGGMLKPLLWSLEQTAHLLIMGGLRNGKGSLLRTLLTALAARYTPEEVEFVPVDYGARALRDYAHLPHTRQFHALVVGKETRDVSIVTDKEEFAAVLKAFDTDLVARTRGVRQGAPLTKRTILAIHNWDLIADAQLQAMLTPLEPYARRGCDIGLHCIVTNTEFGGGAMGLIKSLRANCLEIVMGRPLENSQQGPAINKRFKAVLGGDVPPGMGFLFESAQPPRVAQFAYASDPVAGGTSPGSAPTDSDHSL